jgi:NAD(P)H-flavin reductase
MSKNWYTAQCIKIVEIAPLVKVFTLELDDCDDFQFEPGQFVTLDLPIGDKRLHRWKSYSIASIPNKNFIELCIVKNPNGQGTKYLFEEFNIGDTLKLKGPEGTFVLRKPLEKKVVMIATGTGIVPFKSMIENIQIHNIQHNGIHLIFGTRYESGILYKSYFEEIEQKDSRFKYDITLSKSENIDYKKGYVHQVYLEEYKDNYKDVVFYICGWSQMIDDCVENLFLKLGVDKSQIIYELYG